MNAAQIIDAAVQQLGTDASRATLLSLLQECYGSQVADSRWFRTEASIGATVTAQADYVVPDDIVEAYGVKVGLFPYEAVGEDTMWALKANTVQARSGRGGLFSQGYDATGNTIISLYPAPSTAGLAITTYAARQPPVALTDSLSSTPITPIDTHSSLIAGLAALVLIRVDERPDLAQPFQSTYETGTEKLRRRKNQLLRGSSPTRLLVQGYDF